MNYELLPVHIREGMKNYIEKHELPGYFLQAVISDKLSASFNRAKDININITEMRNIVSFLYWEVPSICWGSEEKMIEWLKLKGGEKNEESKRNS